jgi:cell division protein FtsN
MTNPGPSTSGRSLSVRQLTFLFLLAVAVCAVFFALGFVVGNNQSASRQGPSAEQVAPHSEIPPTVNPPAQDSPPPASPAVSNSTPGSSGVIEQDLKGPVAPPPQVASAGRNSQARANPPQNQAASPVPATASARPRRSESRGMMVQVAASHTKRQARSLVNRLRARGFHAMLIIPRGSGIYRVQVGPFSSRREALRAARRLSREGFRPFIR